jgi:hypothetical protein
MENRVNLRLSDMPGTDWQDDLSERLSEMGLSGSVKLTSSDPPPGTLGSIDPTVVAAIIAGGVQILAAVITVLGDLWLVKRKENLNQGNPVPLVVVIQGNKRTHTIKVDPTELVSKEQSKLKKSQMPKDQLDILIKALDEVGIVREVRIE